MVSRFALLMLSIGCAAHEQPGTCVVGDTRACECLDGNAGTARCFDPSPAVWGSCVCAADVSAVVVAPAAVPHKTTVQLDGSTSSDSQSLTLHFQWTLVAPAGSTAMLDHPDLAMASFVADLAGTYQVTLTVDDGVATGTTTATVVATDEPPMIPAFADRAVETGVVTPLDLSAATDPDGDPLVGFTWQLTSAPASSHAQPAAPTAQVTTFTPDVDGDYRLIGTADDGVRTASAPLLLHSYRHIAPFEILAMEAAPIDARYSASLDRVVVLDQVSLQILDPETGAGPMLGLAGRSLSIAPDGKTAAVAVDHAIAIIDLASATRTDLPLAFDPGDAVIGGNGYVYAWETTSGLTRTTHDILIATGVDTPSADGQTFPGAHGELTGSSLIVEALQNYFVRLDISSGLAHPVGDFKMANDLCLPLWFVSASEFVDRCGAWYSTAPFAELATYPFGFAGAAPVGGDVLVLRLDGDSELRKLVNRVLVADATPLPHFVPSNELTHGSYVFAGPAGVRVVVHGATAWGIVRY